MEKINKFIIRANENYGKRRVIFYFKKRLDAQKQLKRLLGKPKGNKTAYRDALSGAGINNPRISKIRGFV